ncbi:MAG: hypothetical protein AB9900_10985 [Humidesulfovibrio sp.]
MSTQTIKITLPVSGQEVELKALSWEESEKHLAAEGEGLDSGYMKGFLTTHYGKKTWDAVSKARPDVFELYSQTINYTFGGPGAVKNSAPSGPGAPTQTE